MLSVKNPGDGSLPRTVSLIVSDPWAQKRKPPWTPDQALKDFPGKAAGAH